MQRWSEAGSCAKLDLRLPHAAEARGSEDAAVDQAAHPAVAAVRSRLVVRAADGREDPPVEEVPFLDLVVVALAVCPKALEVGAQPILHDAEPRLARIGVRPDAAELEQVVLDLL